MLFLVSVALAALVAHGENDIAGLTGANVNASQLRMDGVALLQDKSMSPVEKVAKLLQDMSKTLQKDAEDDEELNVEMQCWCKSNKKKKTQSVADNTQTSSDLTAEIQSLREKGEQLTTALDHLKKEVDGNQKALDAATEMRKTDFKEFVSAEKSTAQAISELKGAQNALGKILPKSNLQTDMTLDGKSDVVQALARSMVGHHSILWAIHKESERKILVDLMAHSRDVGFIQGGNKALTINAPYDIIHGTIKSLGDAFSANLAKLQQDEEDATAHHEALKKTKKMQIKAGLGSIDQKTQELADTDERAANARQELADTNDVLEADTVFLQQVVEQCAMHDKDYAERIKTRHEELHALSEATSILTNEEARDTFTRTFGHTKRPSEGALGSKLLKDYKEERESESMRSQTNAARKKLWGTSERYLLFQTSSKSSSSKPSGDTTKVLNTEAVQKADTMLKGFKPVVKAAVDSREASKLATIAQRTQHFWAAKYYMDAQKAKKQDSPAAKAKPKVSATSRSPSKVEHKVGLTASQVRLRGNAMADVAKGITKMKENLQLEQGEESAFKEWCVQEIHNTEKALDDINRKKIDQEENIQLIKERIARLQAEVKQLLYNQEDADIELAKVGIDRKETNEEFQKTVLDQKTTKKLLGMALKVLGAFYNKKHASLIRQKVKVDQRSMKAMKVIAGTLYSGVDDPLSFDAVRGQEQAEAPNLMAMVQQDPNSPPPPGFEKYSPNAAKGGLLVMIEGLVADADAMVKEAVKDETRSMENYEAYVAEANKMTKKRRTAIVNRQTEIGKLEQFKLDEMIRLNETIKTKAHLRQTNIDLYGVERCDYFVKNYAIRYVERQEEIQQLTLAEAVLGAHGGDAELTKMSHTEDDTLAKKAEENLDAGHSDFTPVDGGVLVNGPSGEEAVSHLSNR